MHPLNIMASEGGSKLRLDRHFHRVQRSSVKPVVALLTLAVATARPAGAQAPEWAELWRVVGVTLASPAALERGPTGVFWNPAAVRDAGGLAGGVEVLHTPEVVNLSGVLAALTYRLGRVASVGVGAGRVSVGDLVRTTSSPISEGGEIPVYAQFLGVVAGTSVGPAALGAQLRLHDARLDARAENGVTLDVGFRIEGLGPFAVAAATHFATPQLQKRATTDYFMAGECRIGTSHVWGAPAVVIARYGLDVRGTGAIEQNLSGGLAFGDRLRVDAGFQREAAYDRSNWRFAMGLAFRAGRYVIAATRGSGINDVGATYRIGLSAGVLR
jgi:hypothetical protein